MCTAVSQYMQGVRLMLSVRRACPVDYRLCNQTVTVYHREMVTNEAGSREPEFTRTVYDNAFLDFKKTESVDKTGNSEANSFLLIIPCSEQTVFVGDKVLLGTGDKISDSAGWANLIPTKVDGLVVVKYVDLKYWNGTMVHVEAGG